MKKLKKSKLKEADYQYLLVLLEKGYSLQDALQLLSKENVLFKEMLEKLDEGKELKELLVNTELERRIVFYCQYVTLPQAIKVSIDENKQTKEVLEKVGKKIGYTVVVFCVSCLLLSIFSNLVVPSMVDNYQLSKNASFIILEIVDEIKDILLLTLGLINVVMEYIHLKKKDEYLWMYLHKKGKDKLIREVLTYSFSEKLYLLLKAGIPLVDAIKIIRYNYSDNMIKLLAYHFDEALLSGKEFTSALNIEYFDDQFYQLCIYGCQKKDLVSGLENYLTIKEKILDKKLNKACILFKAISYVFIGALIILLYQILLSPLQMLEGLL